MQCSAVDMTCVAKPSDSYECCPKPVLGASFLRGIQKNFLLSLAPQNGTYLSSNPIQYNYHMRLGRSCVLRKAWFPDSWPKNPLSEHDSLTFRTGQQCPRKGGAEQDVGFGRSTVTFFSLRDKISAGQLCCAC